MIFALKKKHRMRCLVDPVEDPKKGSPFDYWSFGRFVSQHV